MTEMLCTLDSMCNYKNGNHSRTWALVVSHPKHMFDFKIRGELIITSDSTCVQSKLPALVDHIESASPPAESIKSFDHWGNKTLSIICSTPLTAFLSRLAGAKLLAATPPFPTPVTCKAAPNPPIKVA